VRDDAAGILAERDAMPPALRPDASPVAEQLAGSYRDRAVGFSIRTWQLSLVVAVVAWLIGGKLLTDHPLLSLGALAWLITGFALVWAGAFVLDLAVSPSGVELLNVLLFWRYLSREQKERFRHYEESRKNERVR
jgi:energy-converting hydrogenase Eha subunit C